MKKRGISPLIATILLIGMTIMVSLIVFNFVRTTIEKKTSETEMQSNIILACAQTLKLEYDDPMPCSSGTDLEVTVWNKSPLDIVDFKIQVLSVSDSELKEGGRLSSYNKTIYTISGINVADVTSVVLIPTIELDEINGTCSGISFDVGDLEAC